MTGATAILLAGSRPGRDPFAEAHGTDLKALIPIDGKPMVRRPVEALLASDRIAAVRVLTQQPERIAAALPADERLSVQPSGPTIAATIEALCDDPETRWPLIVTTADHALLDPGMIADFVERSEGADIAIAMVERRALAKRLPQTRRTWIKLRSGAWSGANLFRLSGPQVRPAIAVWRQVEQDRKKAWRLLSVLGPVNALLAIARLRSLDGLLAGVGRRLNLELKAVAMADPLAAVDVDKESDLQLVEAILAGRA